MKKTALAVLFTLVAASAQAGSILATNYNETTGANRPISTVSGAPIAVGGGVVQLGTFNSTGAALDALIAGLASGNVSALLADFISYGSTNTIGAFPAEHLYASDKSVAIPGGSPLIGKNIYTLIGNAGTLAGSSEFAIIRDDESFAADAPVFQALADISAPIGGGAGQIAVLFGNPNGPSITTALGAAPSLQLAPIPEPMSAALLLSSLALVARRRRA